MKILASSKTTILVVDDEQIVLSLVRDAIEDDEVDVFTASGPAEALEIIEQRPIDLLITDIRMPDIDGLELAGRASYRQPNIRIIFMTGYANLSSAKDAIQHGAIDYILKPFDLKEIRNSVWKAVNVIVENKHQNPQRRLTELKDLRQVLYSADDHRSVALSSLRFAKMHARASHGFMVYRPHQSGKMSLLLIDGENVREPKVSDNTGFLLSDAIEGELPEEPTLLPAPIDHPLFQVAVSPDSEPPFPQWCLSADGLIVIPVRKSEQVYGVIILPAGHDSTRFGRSEVSFFSLTSGQLASALENLALLDTSRNAYRRLKELQDRTVELETLAARGKMSAEIGHELNNFLGVISGNLSLIQFARENDRDEKLEKRLRKIGETVDKMTTFTSNLMDLSSISSTRERIRIDCLLTEVVEFLRPQKRFHDVIIEMPGELAAIELEADSTQLQQLLYNLFNNAADATLNSSERRIKVTLTAGNPEGHFTLTISDSGCGFKPEALKKAFNEQFSTKADGHGFGLFVCKRVVENHGGTVQVESAPGAGSIVKISFPVQTAELEPA